MKTTEELLFFSLYIYGVRGLKTKINKRKYSF